MIQARTKWNIGTVELEIATKIAAELGISDLTAKLLTSRGMTETERVRTLLGGGACYDPYLLKGMQLAVDRIRLAIEQNEKIRIYGDYDADGVSSTALMLLLMEQLGAVCDFYIPHRFHEGYGLNEEAIIRAKDAGIDLIITVDNGISSNEEIALANAIGIDVIVTDHHQPPEILPPALAIINPKQPDCRYPFKELAGVGIAYKLAQALLEEVPDSFLELTTLGTIADLMPLIDENHQIVRSGLKALSHSQLVGMRALLQVSGLAGKPITSTQVGFGLGPRINASGRLEHAEIAVRLLMSTDEQEAAALANELDELNKERQRIVQQTTKEAQQLLEKEKASILEASRVIVLDHPEWNEGVIGIVAARLLEEHYKPSIVFSSDPQTGLAKGSARSIPGLSIYEALKACDHLLEAYGGHEAAAGMTVKLENLDALHSALDAYFAEHSEASDWMPQSVADLECRLSDIQIEAIEDMECLAPFGHGNPAPQFVLRNLQVVQKSVMGKNKQHLKLVVTDASTPGQSLEVVLFGQGALAKLISSSAPLDLLGELGINEWNGIRKPQMLVKDLQITVKQVFDWRGTSDAILGKASADSLAVVQSLHRESWQPALAMTKDFPVDLLPPLLQHMPRVHYERVASSDLSAEVSDLFLASLPPSIEALQKVVSLFGNTERIYVLFMDERKDDPRQQWSPSREMLVQIYSLLKQKQHWKTADATIFTQMAKQLAIPASAVTFGVNVFKELNFIKEKDGFDICAEAPAKQSLEASVLYRQEVEFHQARQFFSFSTAEQLESWILQTKPFALSGT